MIPPPEPPDTPIAPPALPPRRRTLRGILPTGLRADVLYLWSTFRLRERPLKMLLLIVVMGAACWGWEWAGRQWALPPMLKALNQMPGGQVKMLLGRSAGAFFSSLNLLSMLSIMVMARSMRRLLREGHIEALQLTPRVFRPSALFYALASRYVALSLMGLLVVYLDPQSTPFKNQLPFMNSPAPGGSPFDAQLADPWLLRWAAINQICIALYCATNVLMDMSISFWILARWRPSLINTALAVVLIGVISPVGILWFFGKIETFLASSAILDAARRWAVARFPHDPWAASLVPVSGSVNFGYFAGSTHYFLASIISLVIAAAVLWSLDRRWERIRVSKTADPIFIRPVD